MRSLTPLDEELLRKACLRYLAMHHPAGFTAETIAAILQQRSLIDYTPTPEAVTSALSVLADLNLARKVLSPVGSTVYWSATGAGKIEMEREAL